MVRRKERLFAEIMLVADGATLVASFILAYWLRARFLSSVFGPLPRFEHYAWSGSMIVPVFLCALAGCGLYRWDTYQRRRRIAGAVVKSSLLGALMVLSVLYLMKRPDISRLVVNMFVLLSMAALVAEKIGVKAAMDRIGQHRRKHKAWQVLIVGESDDAEAYLRLLEQHPDWGVSVAGVVGAVKEVALAVVSGRGGGAERLVRRPTVWRETLNAYVVDEVVAVSPLSETGALPDLQEACEERGLIFRMLVKLPAARVGRYEVEDMGEGTYMVSLETVPQDLLPLLLKRLMDVAGSVGGLLACALVYLWYSPKLRRESPGPVFFRHVRVGQNGRLFNCYKFRTMYVDAQQRQTEMLAKSKLGSAFIKLEEDPRVTPVGAWMRHHHLDEFPQFWNVLKGEMSIVGPRPSQPVEVSNYEYQHHRRLSMKPGITGLFQIGGHDAVNRFEDVVKLDCAYIDNWSLWLDCKIIAQTLVKVLKADGW